MTRSTDPKVDPRDFEALVDAYRRLASFRVNLHEIAKRSGVGYRTIAYRMHTSLSMVERIVAGKNISLDTLIRFVWACDHEMTLDLRRRNTPE